MQQVDLVGVVVDLLDLEDALDRVTERASKPVETEDLENRPLSVVSANLDHIAQFGRLGRWYDTLDYALGLPTAPNETAVHHGDGSADWLVLLDGAPLVAEATRLTGKTWPRLAGSDIIGPLLDRAEKKDSASDSWVDLMWSNVSFPGPSHEPAASEGQRILGSRSQGSCGP